jgi:hypothetical protein
MLPDFRKSIAFFFKVPRIRPFVFQGKSNLTMKVGMERVGGMILTGKKPKYSEKPLF